MNQYSSPDQSLKANSTLPTNAAVPASEANQQHLGIQLQYEQCLSRLGQRLSEVISLHLEQEESLAAGVAAEVEMSIWRILRQALESVLENERIAIALDNNTPDPTYTICCGSGAGNQSGWRLASGRSVRLELGESLTSDELLAWKTEAPESIWRVQSQAQSIGYLLVCPIAPLPPGAAIDQSTEHPAPWLRSQLIDRGLQQTLLALRQLWGHRQQHQALLARIRELEQTNRLKS